MTFHQIVDLMNYRRHMRGVPGTVPLAELFDDVQASLTITAKEILSAEQFENFTNNLILHPGEIEQTNIKYVEKTKTIITEMRLNDRKGQIIELNKMKEQMTEQPIMEVSKSKAA